MVLLLRCSWFPYTLSHRFNIPKNTMSSYHSLLSISLLLLVSYLCITPSTTLALQTELQSSVGGANIWDVYRNSLFHIMKSQAPRLKRRMDASRYEFQMTADPMDASWGQNPSSLQSFCTYPSRAGKFYEPLVHQKPISSQFKSMIMTANDPNSFRKFMENSKKGLTWRENGVKMTDFLNQVTSTNSDSFLMNFESITRTIYVNSDAPEAPALIEWVKKVFNAMEGKKFVKRVKKGRDDDDDLLEDDVFLSDEELEQEENDLSSIYPPHLAARDLLRQQAERRQMPGDDDDLGSSTISLIDICTNLQRAAFSHIHPGLMPIAMACRSIVGNTRFDYDRIKVKVSAEGFEGISVTPNSWFDTSFLRANKNKLNSFFSRSCPRVPATVWVAYKPHVVLEMKTKSLFDTLHQNWMSPDTKAVVVGGFFFKSPGSDDDDDITPAAEANFSVVTDENDDENIVSEQSDDDTYTYPAGLFESFTNIIKQQEANQNWNEKNKKTYRVEFKATGRIPQVLGVHSLILERA